MGREVIDGDTILVRIMGDIGGLALEPREAFFLTQLDGRLSLDDVSIVVGLDAEGAVRLAERFLALGIVACAAKGGPTSKRPIPREDTDAAAIVRSGQRRRFQMSDAPRDESPTRIDPRAENDDAPTSKDPRAEPAAFHTGRADCIDPTTRRGRVSNLPPSEVTVRTSARPWPANTATGASSTPPRATSVQPGPRSAPPKSRPADDEVPELDAAVLARIMGLDAKLGAVDHYALLEIARDVEKKDIKRAYFAMAQAYHPDRYFGKKLGTARAAIERIFVRLTEAHDTLVDRTKRAAYDARLGIVPRRPSRRLSKSGMTIAPPKIGRRSSRGMRAVKAPLVAPAPVVSLPPPSAPAVSLPPASAPPASKPIDGYAQASAPPPRLSGDPAAGERLRRLQGAARQIEAQQHADVFIRAAEDALRKQDVVGAANNFRLALEAVEDPYVRHRFEQAEALARVRREERLTKHREADERRGRG